MNSSFMNLSSPLISNLSELATESWFIPLDIIKMTSCLIVILSAIIFLIIIIMDKTCHTVPMLLVANSCLAALQLSVEEFWMRLVALQNDLLRIAYQDPFCLFRGYLIYTGCSIFFVSFVLQALYRYVTVVYPTRLLWKSAKSQLALIALTWVIGLGFPLGFLLTGNIVYNVDNQICDIPFRLSAPRICAILCVYGIPVLLTMLIYHKLIKYVKQMGQRVTPTNILLRAHRELKMTQRTITIVLFFLMLGVPYAIFLVISFFTAPPIYHYRIAYLFVDLSLLCVMIALYQSTDPLKLSIKKKLNVRVTTTVPTVPRIGQ